MKRQIDQLRGALSAAETATAEAKAEAEAAAASGGGGRRQAAAPAAEEAGDPAAVARAAQQARMAKLDSGGSSGGGGGGGAVAAASGGGSVEDVLLRGKELRLRLSETDPRSLHRNLPSEIRQTVQDDDIIELSQRRVDAVILRIIGEQSTGHGGDGDALSRESSSVPSGLAIRAEDMSLGGVER